MIFFCRRACCPTDNFFVFLEKCAWPFSGNPLCLLYHSSIITICYVFMLCPAFNGVEKHPHPLSSYALCSRLSFSTPTAPSTGASICCTFAASPWALLQAGRKTHLSSDPMPSRLYPWQPPNIPTDLPRSIECPLAVLANTFSVFRFYCSVILFPFTDCKIPYI